MTATCGKLSNFILMTSFFVLVLLLSLSTFAKAQTNEFPETITVSFQGAGSGQKEAFGQNDLRQTVDYEQDVAFEVTGVNPVQEGNYVTYELSRKNGTLHFKGTAEDFFNNETTVIGFDKTREIDIQISGGILRYPINNCNDIYIKFTIPPLHIDYTVDEYSRSLEYFGLQGIVRHVAILPFPFNIGILDNIYDVDGTSDHECCSISLEIDKNPLLPGETAIVTASTTVVAGQPLEWELIFEEESDVKAEIKLDGGLNKTARITEVSGDGYVLIKVTNPSHPDCKNEIWIKIGCEPCEREECKDGNCIKGLPGEGIRWNTGRTSRGRPAGEIFLPNDEVNCANTLLGLLEVRSGGDGVEVLSDVNGLRQVISPDSFVDISVIDDYGFTISFYKPDDMGDLVNGYYEVLSGATPHVIWKVENPDGSQGPCDRLRIVEERGGSVISSSEYAFNGVDNKWSFSDGNGLQVTTQQEEIVSGNRVETQTVKDESGVIASRVKTTYKDIVCASGSREEVIETVEDPDGFALTTTTTWYEDPSVVGSCGKIESQVYPDGSWVKYEYDGLGRIAVEIRSWLDAPFNTPAASAHAIYYDYTAQHEDDSQAAEDTRMPRKVTEEILGNIVSKTYYVYVINADGSRTNIVERSVSPALPYGDPENQRSASTYYAYGTGTAESGRIKSVAYPDGRLDEYTYLYGTYTPGEVQTSGPGGGPYTPSGIFTPGAGKDVFKKVVHGTVDSPAGIAFKTTSEIEFTSELGNLLLHQTGAYNGDNYGRFDWIVQSYDDFGHLIEVFRTNGTKSESAWDCCGKVSDTDTRGIIRSYTYDDLKRVETETKQTGTGDIVTTYTYDGSGRRLTETVSAMGLSLSTLNSYDTAGRLQTRTDAAGLVKTYNYAQGGRITTVTQPGGFTEITEQYLDGRTKSISGLAVIAEYYSYGVNPDGTQWARVDIGSATSPMWEKTTVDILGRSIRVEKPGYTSVEATENFYNSKGQLVKTTTIGQADTLYTYDETGNQISQGLDVDNNGVLETGSNDRINETQTIYKLIGDDWWQETENKTYAEESSDTATVTGIQRTRLKGLGVDGLFSEAVTIDIFGNQTINRGFIDRASKTETQVTDFADSDIDGVSISVNGLLVSQKSKTGVTTTYSYDPLERLTGVTDPRTGTSVTHYNDKGQVDYVDDAALNRTQFTYDLTTGRKTADINPLNKATRYEYNDRGQIIRTWGDNVYPVEYLFDGFGRIGEIHTWRVGSSWNGVTWPADVGGSADKTRWHYQESTSLLTSKEDHSSQSISYTYTDSRQLATRTWARTDGTDPINTTYSYDPDTGELKSIDYSDSTPDITFTYDRLGRQKTISDAAGDRTFTYNGNLQLESETITGIYDKVITRTYDSHVVIGRSTGITTGSDYSVSYGYDDAGRFGNLSWDIGGSSQIATYTYAQNSDLINQVSTDNGLKTTYNYDPKRNIKTTVKNEFGIRLISQYDYQYDKLERRTSIANSGEAFAAVTNAFNQYDYNDRNELTQSARYLGADTSDTSSPVLPENRSYDYDPIGNRKQTVEGANTETYTSNVLNQYTQQDLPGGGTNNFTYDLDGNLTEISDGTTTTEYLYNGENRLVAVQSKNPVNGDKKVEFTYDYMGRRVQKIVFVFDTGVWVLASDKRFVYDGWNLISELTVGVSQSIEKYYVWGLDLSQTVQGAGGIGGLMTSVKILAGDFDGDGVVDGADLAELANNSNLMDLAIFSSNFGRESSFSSDSGYVLHYYFNDGYGNVGQLVDSGSGNIVAHYEYDPFGNQITAAGPHVTTNPYRFSTKYSDSETGLFYYGYRYYSPKLGRWLVRDPLGEAGGNNLYTFVKNNPSYYWDYLGLDPKNKLKKRPSDFQCLTIMAKHESKIYRESLNLIETGVKDALPNYSNMPFQHCVWNCRMTLRKGKEYAEQKSALKERVDELWAKFGIELKNSGCWDSVAGFYKKDIAEGARSAYQPADFQDNKTGRACACDIETRNIRSTGSLFDCERCCTKRGVPPNTAEGPNTPRRFGRYASSFPKYNEDTINDATNRVQFFYLLEPYIRDSSYWTSPILWPIQQKDSSR